MRQEKPHRPRKSAKNIRTDNGSPPLVGDRVGNNFLFEELASLRLRNAIGGDDGRRQLTFPLERRADKNAKKPLASVIACCARAGSTWGSKSTTRMLLRLELLRVSGWRGFVLCRRLLFDKRQRCALLPLLAFARLVAPGRIAVLTCKQRQHAAFRHMI
jgi:hypothetical protein